MFDLFFQLDFTHLHQMLNAIRDALDWAAFVATFTETNRRKINKELHENLLECFFRRILSICWWRACQCRWKWFNRVNRIISIWSTYIIPHFICCVVFVLFSHRDEKRTLLTEWQIHMCIISNQKWYEGERTGANRKTGWPMDNRLWGGNYRNWQVKKLTENNN